MEKAKQEKDPTEVAYWAEYYRQHPDAGGVGAVYPDSRCTPADSRATVPPPPPDLERDYTKAPPQKRYQTVEQKFDESAEAKRMQREHLLEHGWDTFGAANW